MKPAVERWAYSIHDSTRIGNNYNTARRLQPSGIDTADPLRHLKLLPLDPIEMLLLPHFPKSLSDSHTQRTRSRGVERVGV